MRVAIPFLFLFAAGTAISAAETISENTEKGSGWVSTENIDIVAGTLSLSNATISHDVTITAGTFTNTGTLAVTGNLSVADGTTFTLNDAQFGGNIDVASGAGTATFNLSGTANAIGAASGNFAFVLAENSALVLNSAFSGTLSALTLSDSSSVKFLGNATLGTSSVAIAPAAGTLDFASGVSTFASATDLSSATVLLNGGDLAGEDLTLGNVSVLADTALGGNITVSSLLAGESTAMLTIASGKQLQISNAVSYYSNVLVSTAGVLTVGGAGTLSGSGNTLTFLSIASGGGFVLAADVSGQTLNVAPDTKLILDTPATITKINLTSGTLGANQPATVTDLDVSGASVIDSSSMISVSNQVNPMGTLTITSGSTLDATMSLTRVNAVLDGAGTLKGDLNLTAGTLGIASVDGNVISSGTSKKTVNAANLSVTGTWTNTGVVDLANNLATLTIAGGALNNSGTLIVNGSTFVANGINNTGTLQINAGADLVGTAVTFATGSTLVIDVSQMASNDTFDAIAGLTSTSFGGVNLRSTSGASLDGRFSWSGSTWIFLGLDGRVVKTTIYPEFLREQALQTFRFAETVVGQIEAASVRKPLFGATRKTSHYMRGYLERSRRFDRSENKPEIVPVEEENPGDYAKRFEKALAHAWIAGTTANSTRERKSDFLKYEMDARSVLLGTDLPFSETWSSGLTLSSTRQTLKTLGEPLSHKLETDFYQGLAYLRYSDREGDSATFAFFGGNASTDSTRGSVGADFDSWQMGALMDLSMGFMPSVTSLWRMHMGLKTVYSHSDSFEESGTAGALSVESAHAWVSRASLGTTYAWLPVDPVQISCDFRLIYDFGSRQNGISAYDVDTVSDVRLLGRKYENFAWQLNLSGDWQINENFSVFGGITGTKRKKSDEIQLTIGARMAF
ncbi:MAG: autotransporter domain-containing protein [Opitutales bacterium]|nr:autotransporter domain-containing protein [Opitutales bacterium]